MLRAPPAMQRRALPSLQNHQQLPSPCSNFHRHNAPSRLAHARCTNSNDLHVPTALEGSRTLAQIRQEESMRGDCLLTDDVAALFVESHSAPIGQELDLPQPERSMSRLADVLITRFIDDELLKITSMVNVNRGGQEYNQVVLIGDGMCTRAFRLPWPSGVAMYLVAPAEVHERAEAILASNKIRAPRGCLLRRVDCNIQNAGSCANALQQAGYRGDRVAAWAIQGLMALNLGTEAFDMILTDASNSGAMESIIIGEYPYGMNKSEVETKLSSFGLLGTAMHVAEVADCLAGENDMGSRNLRERLLSENDGVLSGRGVFRAQQRRLSLDEMDMYRAHVAAAEEVDEDFFGNFS